jgi:hypothetical protein
MKRLFVIAAIGALSVTSAIAADVGYFKNASGGLIVLRADDCQIQTALGVGSMSLMSSDGKGASISGCWTLVDKLILAVFEDQEVRLYPVTEMTPSPDFQKFMANTKRHSM